MKLRWLLVIIIAFPVQHAWAGPENAEKESGFESSRAQIRFGAFFVNRINTGLQINSRKVPILGSYIDTENTLGMRNSETVPVVSFSYRIKGNHRISFGWFNLRRDGSRQLEKEITIGDGKNATVIPVNATVDSYINTEYYKLKYNYVFFNHPKVSLSIGAGLHVTKLDFGLKASGLVDENVEVDGTAPLPVIGGALLYRLSPRMMFALRLDEFFISYSDYEGSMTETNALIEYRAFKKIGFGFGITRFKLDVNMNTHEIYARFNNAYQGFSFYTAVYF